MRLPLIFFGLSSVFIIVSSLPLGSVGLEKKQDLGDAVGRVAGGVGDTVGGVGDAVGAVGDVVSAVVGAGGAVTDSSATVGGA
ncbi:hypothetical protein G6F37_010123 [Rhizopus arrhizus]|nr:hypothetical protein G6F38_013995 [Rhizopus arrhizus]KAG1153703.1 hypothetical protein G6F37_010123 [Rhizopus arrhizus]